MISALLVEDDPAVRESLAEKIRKEGIHVTAVGSYSEGLSRLGTGGFDLFVIDSSEETPRGACRYGLSKWAKESYPCAVILCVTGNGSDSSEAEEVISCFDATYCKPVFMGDTKGLLRNHGLVH